jgi:hypothetical protein
VVGPTSPDPSGRHIIALDTTSVTATWLSTILRDRPDGTDRNLELRNLLEDQRAVGSGLATRLLGQDDLPAAVWVVEPIVTDAGRPTTAIAETVARAPARALARSAGASAGGVVEPPPQPMRNPPAPVPPPTAGPLPPRIRP